MNSEERFVMKKHLTIVLAVALATLTPTRSNAGDKEWAVVGKVLTGITAAAIVGQALSEPPVYYPQPVVHVAPKRPVHFVPSHTVHPAPQIVAAPKIVVRERPRFRRHRTVIVERPSVIVRPQRVYVRERPVRGRRYVTVAPPVCPTRY